MNGRAVSSVQFLSLGHCWIQVTSEVSLYLIFLINTNLNVDKQIE